MNSYYYGRRKFHEENDSSPLTALAIVVSIVAGIASWIAVYVLHISEYQILAVILYIVVVAGIAFAGLWCSRTRKSRIQNRWPHPPLSVPMLRDRKEVCQALRGSSIVLGYDIDRKPWLWSDEVRVMQALLIGQSGAGKTTLLKNIITQDIQRFVGPKENRRRVPMIILGGKGDKNDLVDLIPEIAAAGRLHQLRVLDPSQPQISAKYNPFYCKDDAYQEHVNFIFQSFALKQDFFSGHQAAYLSDLARVLWHTGKRFNIHDVLVMALDPLVMKEQIELARRRLVISPASIQRKLNFEMSARNLLQSCEDRDRVPKIQGLLNELMTFLEDELSIVTGPYDDLLTLDDVVEQELILFVSLNTNRNSRAVTALGRMLLQNMQLLIGKKYDQDPADNLDGHFVSIVLDEFAPFAYPAFSQTLQTARGTRTAFLFSLQSVSQLDTVSLGFRHDVLSAPNTVMCMRTRDEESARYFLNASAKIKSAYRTMTVEKHGVFEEQYREMGFGSMSEMERTRAEDFHIKNLPRGQMEILQTDTKQGTLHSHLHVRRPIALTLPGIEYSVPPSPHASGLVPNGAYLTFKSSEPNQRLARIQGRKRLADYVIK